MTKCTCPAPSNWTITWCSLCDGIDQHFKVSAPYSIAPACFNLPKDNCIPATAKAIMDLDRKPDPRGSGIQRAVDALSRNSLMNSYRRGEG